MIATLIKLIFGIVIVLLGSVPSIVIWNIPVIKRWRKKPAHEAKMLDNVLMFLLILVVFIALPLISFLFIANVIDPDGKILRVFFDFFPNDNL